MLLGVSISMGVLFWVVSLGKLLVLPVVQPANKKLKVRQTSEHNMASNFLKRWIYHWAQPARF